MGDKNKAVKFIKASSQPVSPIDRSEKLKIIVGKPGLDGHSLGAKTIQGWLERDGFNVVFTGLKMTAEEIVNKAKELGANVIGLSIQSDAHNTHVVEVARLMREQGFFDTPGKGLLVIGGTIPQEEISNACRLFR